MEYRIEVYTRISSIVVPTHDEMELTVERLTDETRIMQIVILNDKQQEIGREVRR